jgi:hypothetical protein
MAFGSLGALGRGFGRLGAVLGSTPDPEPPEDAPVMQFDDETNSQLLALLEDI